MKRRLFSLFRLYKQEFALLLFSIITILLFIPIFTYIYFAKDLTTKESIMNRNNTGIILFDKNGDVFFRFYEAQYKEFVPLSKIPNHVQDAVIVAEDKEFYQHPGFSLRSIFAAFIANLKYGELSYGGSTITQQLVKNSLLNSKKSLLRKYEEVILAQEIERRFSKKEILEMYLNSVYFGEGAFGIASAAKTYFNKSVSELSIGEASILAGLLTAPSRYSPLSGDIQESKKRQKYVLSELVQEKLLTESQAKKALQEPLRIPRSEDKRRFEAPHFALMVKDELIRKYGEERIARSGFQVHTTIDLTWQRYAEAIVQEQVKKLEKQGATNASVAVIDPSSGEVRVLVGSKDWFDNNFGKVNMATTPRQPGSSFKPIVYSLALSKKIITPATMLKDERTTFQGDYTPQNYDRRFRGPVLVRRALANSLNIPAVDVQRRVGIEETLLFAKELGITTLGEDSSQYGLSLALGAGSVSLIELTNVYATFANGGIHYPLTIITRIDDKQGKTIYKNKKRGQQVIDTGVAFLISSILSDNTSRREIFGNVLTISRPAAVKTGTTENYRDALTMGYTPQLAVGVWVGNNDNSPMNEIAGSLGAAPIWKQLMEKYHEHLPVKNFTPPRGVIRLAICKNNGFLLRTQKITLANEEYFLEGTGPTRTCYPSIPRPTQIVGNNEKRDGQPHIQVQEVSANDKQNQKKDGEKSENEKKD